MNKILVVYNICGFKKDNTDGYLYFLNALNQQTFNGERKIIVSACKPREHTIPKLKQHFPDFDYITTDEALPVNITFNNAVQKSVAKYGEFDAYIYMSCDSLFTQTNQLQGLFNIIKDNPAAGLVSAQIDIDSCYAYGLKLGGGRHAIDDENARYEMFKDGYNYKVPPGRACAAHVNLYTNEMFKFYGNCCPDIFAGYCTESIFSFVVAAIKRHWIISRDILVRHAASFDGGSCAVDAEANRAKKPNTGGYDHPVVGETLLPIFTNDYAKSLGLGYEECQSIVVHDDSQFDENFFCKNEELKEYIKQNLFLTKDKFDYDKIDCKYV